MGEVWNGPIKIVSCSLEKGPMYRPLEYSACTIFESSSEYVCTDSLLGGHWVWDTVGKSTRKPLRRPDGMSMKWKKMLALCRAFSHAAALYGVRGERVLCVRAALGSMGFCSTA